ncbi:cell division protein FtsQ/DivIB [Rickettsiales endosymbiont of Trichoplax sp. H2]|uniref:cell division protein FtsQ/DivIB n=1 Tax=Rickettsiales endosymbiont of Trichoplax sp. H2 TaxID=2021221 RepID=UPI0012B2423C|nr:cell division protein FtsQ/DivIB [Rickettsiales endosymbiont of Trichoplax sp. H2]MSO14158.1 Cell division protein FtsQ [Rickettsiales endosymbiont of Trichoplax sp. H2]
MIRRFILKLFILLVIILLPYYYLKNKGYLVLIKDFAYNNFSKFGELKKIDISGNYLLSEQFLIGYINIKIGQKLYDISPDNIRYRLLELNEIKEANVSINYSGIIKINIIERKPFAIWWNQNLPILVDDEGNEILKISDLKKYKNHVIIFGQNFHNKLKIFLDLFKQFSLYNETKSLHYIGNRRWDVYIENDVVIKLPEKNIDIALKKSEEVLKRFKYKDRIAIIDLRLYPKKIFLKLKNNI